MNRLLHTILLTLILAPLPPVAYGQAEKVGNVAPVRAVQQPAAPAPYLLAAEDVISINVINFTNLSTQMEIPPDGKVTVPLLDPILVVGKTTEEVTEILRTNWSRYVIHPSITVTLVRKRPENILLYGFVNKVGTIDYHPDLHLIEALAKVGGAMENGDLSQVALTRKDGQKLTIDLRHPEKKGGTEADLLLQVGDMIYIPE